MKDIYVAFVVIDSNLRFGGEYGKYPSYEICPCCGVEFGNEDYTLTSILEYRKNGLSLGVIGFLQ